LAGISKIAVRYGFVAEAPLAKPRKEKNAEFADSMPCA